MTRIKLILYGVISSLFLLGCNEILEPVSLFSDPLDYGTKSEQENFNIKVKSLTFKSAQKANNAAYPRRVMLTGIGSKANVFEETDFTTTTIPPMSPIVDYQLGTGDRLLFTQLNEYHTSTNQLPTKSSMTDYLLGIGDELTFIQLNESANELNANILSIQNSSKNGGTGSLKANQTVLKTSGLVGTDGNILLLGLGKIKAENRTLNDIQTEVRNILIRNGLTPSFQLEITGFNSKMAFITFPNPENIFGHNIVPLTNLPVSLKEIVMKYGLQSSSEENAVITLSRKDQKFRIAVSQIFDVSFPRIILEDKDQIEINKTAAETISSTAVVGSRGNILISGILC